jgi:hypothetical protein
MYAHIKNNTAINVATIVAQVERCAIDAVPRGSDCLAPFNFVTFVTES